MVQVAGHAPFGVAREIEIGVHRRAPLEVAHVDARLADTLHGDQADHHPGPLDAGGVAARPAVAVAPAAGAEIGLLPAPVAGQRADRLGGHAGLGLLPFGRFRDAVLVAHDIGLPDIEAQGLGLDELLVVEPFLDPHVGDRQGEGGVGGRLGGDPLAAQHLGGVVVERIDVDDLDIEVLEPLAADGALEGAVGPGRAFRVGGPEDHHLGFLHQILDGAVGLALADPQALAPMVDGTPVPAFPAVRVVVDPGHADGVDEPEGGRQVVADIAPGMVGAVAHGDGAGAVLALLALDLVRHDVEGLVPGNFLVARLSPVPRVAFAVGVEVDALQGLQEPVRRIDHALPVLAVCGERGFSGRGECLAARFDGPGFRVGIVEDDGRDADDPAALLIDEDRPAVGHGGVAGDAVPLIDAVFPARRLGQHHGLSPPGGGVLVALHGEVEVLQGVDLIELVDRRHQEVGR